MKKLICALLALCVLAGLAACDPGGTPDVTAEALTKANGEKALLAAHENWSNVYRAEFGQNDNCVVTKDCTFVEFPQDRFSILKIGGEEWYYLDIYAGGKPVFYHWYAMTDEEREQIAFDESGFRNLLDPKTTPKETVTEIRDNRDGTLTVTTEATPDAWLGDGERSLFPDDVWDCDHVKCVYFVDKRTLELRSSRAYFVKGDRQTLIGDIGVSYDTPLPDKMTEMLEAVETFKNADPKDRFLLTVVYNAGTPQEERFSTTLVKKQPMTLQQRAGYALYRDPEGTKPFTGKFGEGDVVLYAFPKEAT